MPEIKLLSESDLRSLVQLDGAAVNCVEDAFRALAGGKVVMPPILSMAITDFNGEVDVKTAYVPGLGSFAIKMSPGFFDNPKLGLPSTSGLMTVFSTRTGQLQALLLDNGYLTDVRTAAAGAVAARHLARRDASRACIIGTGMQAALQPYVDGAISKTVNVPQACRFSEFDSLYQRAYALGLKGVTAFRPTPVTGAVVTVPGPDA